MTDFARDDRVRINWPGTDLHGHTAAVRQDAMVKSFDPGMPDPVAGPGYMIILDVPAGSGQRALIIPAERLVPEGGEQS